VLLEHSAVSQAAVFGVPHVNLGEDIVAAVSLHQCATATEIELRHFLAQRLADFKVPRQIQILADLPKSSSGKVQRSLLAKRVGPISESERLFRPRPSPPEVHRPLDQMVAEIWKEVLNLERVGSQDNFFELGGDSIRLTQVVARLEQRLKRKISLRLLFKYPTLAVFSEQLGGKLLADQEALNESNVRL
jgi:acyl carrier protein